MPAAPPAVFTPPAAPAPGAAPAVFVPAGVPTPGAPEAVFVAPGVPAPAVPGAVFVVPGVPTPAVPSAVFVAPVSGGAMIATLTGSLTPATGGVLQYAGLFNGKDCWSADGTTNGFTTHNTVIYWATGSWRVQNAGVGADYIAAIVSTAALPDGLVGWTISAGTGQPTVVISGGLAAPPAIFTP